MNLLEHYVEKIYREEEITEQFFEKYGYEPNRRVYKVDMDVDCY